MDTIQNTAKTWLTDFFDSNTKKEIENLKAEVSRLLEELQLLEMQIKK